MCVNAKWQLNRFSVRNCSITIRHNEFMVLFGRRRRYKVRTGLIWSSIVLKPSHRPVFDCFRYVKTVSEQKWTVGRPGNETSLEAHTIEVEFCLKFLSSC